MAETGKLRDDPLWFKDAVFYEVYVRGFYDSNGDGVGDFAGLAEKLDYLEWLGVDCLWLLPMYASPLRDGGYDIADYYSILPEYGTLEDFRRFIDAAHARGIRVITDLVVNHTSDQHPWFKAARRSTTNRYRDYYVWRADPPPDTSAQVVFPDREDGIWEHDP
ncbi:MAG TPA: alpha-amylase family glycosyl hydrolase, partial [Pyrinomonadaceae bacterium]